MTKSEKIIKLLKAGKTQYALMKLGYSPSTVRYHYRKLNNPEAYEKLLEKRRERFALQKK